VLAILNGQNKVARLTGTNDPLISLLKSVENALFIRFIGKIGNIN
jgi:hypothetical protein